MKTIKLFMKNGLKERKTWNKIKILTNLYNNEKV